MRYLVIGDLTHDVFLTLHPEDVALHCNFKADDCEIAFKYGQKIPVAGMEESLGGNAANVTMALSRLGAEPYLSAQIGDDDFGRQALRTLRSHKITTAKIIIKVKEKTNLSTVVRYRGERTIFSYHYPRYYHLDLSGKYDSIYLSSLGVNYMKVYDNVLQLHKNIKLIFQPGTIQLKDGTKRLSRILKRTDILIVNRTEAEELALKKRLGEKELLHALLDLGPKEVVITDGRNGSFVTDGLKFYHIGIWPGVVKKEATGIGDAFAAALVVAREENDLIESVKWGALNASGVMRFIGAQVGLRTKTEIVRLMKRVKIKSKEL